jgi:DUF438 domain-containing protein
MTESNAPAPGGLDAAQRKEELKRLIRDLHRGGNVDDIRRRFSEMLGQVSAEEVARMEQELIAEGLPAEEVRELCDVHVSVFQQSLVAEGGQELPPGHPVHTFKYENFAVGQMLELMQEAMAALPDPDAFRRARAFGEQLSEVDTIYRRKENLLFPFLEKHGVGGPSTVMWGIHDDIRGQIKSLRQALNDGETSRAQDLFSRVDEAIRSMFFKEEHILYPTALKMLSESEWVAIRDQSGEIGYCIIIPGDEWRPTAPPAELPRAAAYEETPTGEVALDTGSLTPDEIRLLFNHLPVDVTYVDENDTVRFYSESPLGRIFVRTPAVIGRRVQNCHPPHSVHVVNRILGEFREGTRDVAEFWIQMQEKFVHIRYFAVRDQAKEYRGALEVVQDITALRALAGERRLLDV